MHRREKPKSHKTSQDRIYDFTTFGWLEKHRSPTHAEYTADTALNFPTPWSRVPLEEQLVPRLFNIFSAFYASKKFITVSTTAHRLSLSCAKLIQSTPSHPASLSSILISSSYLCWQLPNNPFLSRVPTDSMYAFLLSPMHATCQVHLILHDSITRIIIIENTINPKAPH